MKNTLSNVLYQVKWFWRMNGIFFYIIGTPILILGFLWYVYQILEERTPYNPTDIPPVRSGMELLTDAETGCQYLSKSSLIPRIASDGKSSLIPRIASDGKSHMGCKQK